MDKIQLKSTLIESRYASIWDGWPILLEAIFAALIIFLWLDNAVVSLIGFVLAFFILSNKVIGTLTSLALGCGAGWWSGHSVYLKYSRWDFGVVAGLTVAFFVFAIHLYHVRAFDRG